MSEFNVPIVRVSKIENHPDADRLSLIYFNEYITISAKLDDGSHRYKEGQLVIYVPEGAVVPEYLLRHGFWDEDSSMGILSGSKGNRVKAKRLRGVVSQGIMFPTKADANPDDFGPWISNNEDQDLEVKEGDNVAEFLGIIKYEPPVPGSLAGEVRPIPSHMTKFGDFMVKFDVENIKHYNRVLIEGEEVVITEKLHGTMAGIGYVPGIGVEGDFWGDFFCFSKGLGNRGLVFKNNEKNASNVYVKNLVKLLPKFQDIMSRTTLFDKPYFWFGEIFGQGVQDLTYGASEPTFRLFDSNLNKEWLPWDVTEFWANELDIETAPVLYLGPWHPALRDAFTSGKSTLAGHIREGIVIKTVTPRYERSLGRVILKDVSQKYLLRKNGTEFA